MNNRLKKVVRALEAAMRQVADLMDQLAGLSQPNPHDVHQSNLQRMDGWHGDYKHRENGKRPLPKRFRYMDEEPKLMTASDWKRAVQPRLHREKSDVHRGRRNGEKS